jgi:hypothetical protein
MTAPTPMPTIHDLPPVTLADLPCRIWGYRRDAGVWRLYAAFDNSDDMRNFYEQTATPDEMYIQLCDDLFWPEELFADDEYEEPPVPR